MYHVLVADRMKLQTYTFATVYAVYYNNISTTDTTIGS